jgi:uncharacterized protein
MEKIFICVVLIGAALSGCQKKDQQKEIGLNEKVKNMKGMVSIIEIPVSDFSRAVKFYQTILNASIEEVDMGGTTMGVFPSDGETVNVVLVKGDDYKPSAEGAVVYLHAGDDLQPTLTSIEKSGGRIIVPKTQISPEMGFFAIFIDSEGNKLGLHSSK